MNIKGLLRTCIYGVSLAMGILLLVNNMNLFNIFKTIDWSHFDSANASLFFYALFLILFYSSMIIIGGIGLILSLVTGGNKGGKLYYSASGYVLMFAFFEFLLLVIITLCLAGSNFGDLLKAYFTEARFYLFVLVPVIFLIVRLFIKTATLTVRGIVAASFSIYMIVIVAVYNLTAYTPYGIVAFVLMIAGGALYTIHEFIPEK